MKELVTLFLLLHNPASDEDVTLAYAQYELSACIHEEMLMNAGRTQLAKQLNNDSIEIVETYCDESMH